MTPVVQGRQLGAGTPLFTPIPARHQAPRQARAVPCAALPADPATLAQVAAAAAATSSLLTATWLRSRRWQRNGSDSAAAAAASAQGQEPSASAPPQPEASSVQQVWEAAWAPFGTHAPQPAAQPAADAADCAAGPAESAAAALAPYEEEPVASKPLLLLQGIQGSARVRLLALALAALEAAVERLPPAAVLLSQAQWRAICTALLVNSSLAAAAAWLGYVPEELIQAARVQLSGLEPSALAAAGITHHPSVGLLGTGKSSSSSSGGSSESGSKGGGVRSTRIESLYWVGLEERAALYCSVLRLLRSYSIAQPPQGNGADKQQQERQQQVELEPAAARGSLAEPGPSSSSSSSSSRLEAPLARSSAGLDAVAECSGALGVRQQAMQSLQGAGASSALRGWRATSAGVRSTSQLLALAPSVLQDMAVMAAEAAAAGYLSDVESGLDAGAALQAASALRAGLLGSRGSSNASSSSSVMEGGDAWGLAPDGADAALFLGTAAPELAAAALAASSSDAGEGSGAGEEGGSSGLVPLEASYWPTFTHRQLSSTRQLQRFTNQVVLRRWIYHHYHSVAAMYEDRMDLFGLSTGAALQARRVPLRRVGELGRLRGARFGVSLLLELCDLAAPALRALWRKASAFVSWLLVRLIGQSLGLIYRGIKMSLSSNQGQQQQQQRGRKKKGAGAKQQQREEGGNDEAAGVAGGWAFWGAMS